MNMLTSTQCFKGIEPRSILQLSFPLIIKDNHKSIQTTLHFIDLYYDYFIYICSWDSVYFIFDYDLRGAVFILPQKLFRFIERFSW